MAFQHFCYYGTTLFLKNLSSRKIHAWRLRPRRTANGSPAAKPRRIPASGRSFSLPFVDLFQARDGKIVAHRIYWDNATLMAQLGAMPGA